MRSRRTWQFGLTEIDQPSWMITASIHILLPAHSQRVTHATTNSFAMPSLDTLLLWRARYDAARCRAHSYPMQTMGSMLVILRSDYVVHGDFGARGVGEN